MRDPDTVAATAEDEWQSPWEDDEEDEDAVDPEAELERRLRDLTLADILRQVDLKLAPSRRYSSAGATVLLPTEDVSFYSAAEAAVEYEPEDSREHHCPAWSPVGVFLKDQQNLGKLLEGADEKPGWVVRCCNWSSMASGDWSVWIVSHGRRGYVYADTAAAEDIENHQRILAAWEPAANDDAMDAACLAAYEENWESLCLPPMLGEQASAAFDLVFRGMDRIVARDRTAWGSCGTRDFLLLPETVSKMWRMLQEDNIHDSLARRAGVDASAARELVFDLLQEPRRVLDRAFAGKLRRAHRRVLVRVFADLID